MIRVISNHHFNLMQIFQLIFQNLFSYLFFFYLSLIFTKSGRWHSNSSTPSATYLPSNNLNQCCLIVNWTLRNKRQWNLNQNTKFFIPENVFENVICEMAAILPRRRWVKHHIHSPTYTACVAGKFLRIYQQGPFKYLHLHEISQSLEPWRLDT